jgi:hypothetical protein
MYPGDLSKIKEWKMFGGKTGLQLIIYVDHAIAQAVSCWLLTAEVWVHNQDSQCGICGGQSGTGTGFSPSPLDLPCQYHSADAPYSLMYYLGMDNGPVSGCSATEI